MAFVRVLIGFVLFALASADATPESGDAISNCIKVTLPFTKQRICLEILRTLIRTLRFVLMFIISKFKFLISLMS